MGPEAVCAECGQDLGVDRIAPLGDQEAGTLCESCARRRSPPESTDG